MKKAFFTIRESVFGSGCTFFINWTEKQINSYFKKEGFECKLNNDKNIEGKMIAVEKNKRTYHFIIVKDFDWTIKAQSNMAHKILHLVFLELGNRGFELTESSEEAYTYLFGYYFKNAWEVLKDYNTKQK